MIAGGDSAGTGQRRERLHAALAQLGHLLPAQAPLREFVHHNTLHGLQHLPFERALAEAEALTGRRALPSEARFRDLYRAGRVRDEDLDAALAARLGPALDVVVADAGGRPIRRGEVLRVALTEGLDPIHPGELSWRLEEERVLAGREPLWRACLAAFGLSGLGLHPETLMDLPEDLVETLLVRFRAEDGEDAVSGPALHERMVEDALAELDRLFDGVGRALTARGLLLALTGQDLLDAVAPSYLRTLAAHLDEGQAAWRAPGRSEGLYASWRRLVGADLGLDLTEAPSWRAARALLPADPLEAVEAGLDHLGVEEERWEGYLTRLALELPGWSGMVRWREEHPEHAASREAPVALVDALAIRLFLDAQHLRRVCTETWRVDGRLPALHAWLRGHPAEAMVRLALYSGELPDDLAHRARSLAEDPTRNPADRAPWRGLADMIWTWRQSPVAPEAVGETVYRDAWPLFRLAARLDLSAAQIAALSAPDRGALMAAAGALSRTERGMIWLEAYERPYRERLLAALTERRPAEPPPAPTAQVICCIDDREEGFRRHLEERRPDVQTFGVAGFFGLPLAWRGLGEARAVALCPVNQRAGVGMTERPRAGAELALARWRRGREAMGWLLALVQAARRDLLLGALAVGALAAPLGLALAGRALAPGRWGGAGEALTRALAPPVPTRLTLAPEGEGAARLGLTDEEQAERVGALLENIGLTGGFARLVLLLGHGSSSLNNPYRAAYACGACGGRHGGPNARAFAAMANRPEVRARLRARGIAVPEQTWFLGGEHDTATEEVRFFDLEDLPPGHAEALADLERALALAGRGSARERCRRFASAPRDPDEARALAHVRARSRDPGQARPELGHATVAAAVVGRRALTRGLFLDRRAFLVSYDPELDADGRILARLLSAVVPVGAGINLEYYFSSANDTGYGSGTKAAHNVAGLLGVLDGASGDLRTGLPRQMTEIHEPMRMLMVVEALPERLAAIAEQNAEIRELVHGGWVQLVALEPGGEGAWRLAPGRGWETLARAAEPTPVAPSSAAWTGGRDGPLPPARIGGAGA